MNFEEIKARAFAHWINRGRPEGSPEIDWITAVVELSMEGEAKVDADLQKAITDLMTQLKTGTPVGPPNADLQAQLDKAKADLADAQKVLADQKAAADKALADLKASTEAEETGEVDLAAKLTAAETSLKAAQQGAADAKAAAEKAQADAKAASDKALADAKVVADKALADQKAASDAVIAATQKALDEALAVLAALKKQPPPPAPGALTITAKSPEANATNVPVTANVTATFSQAVNSDTVTTTTFRMRAQGETTDVPAKVEPDAAHLVFTLTPNAPTTAGTQYTVTIDGTVKDASPQGVALGTPVSWSFTTASAAPPGPPTPAPPGAPTIQSVTPANGTTGIALNAKVVVTFSKPMNAATINSSTFTLRASGAQSDVLAKVSMNDAGTVATLMPNNPTAANTTYTVTVSGRVADADNVQLGSDAVISFTTGAA